MTDIVANVTNLVTSNDDMVGTGEGLQCLILQALWHANAGNIRKAWLSCRRALQFSQLIGLHRGDSRALQFVDGDPKLHALSSTSLVSYCLAGSAPFSAPPDFQSVPMITASRRTRQCAAATKWKS